MTEKVKDIEPIEKGIERRNIVVSEFDITEALHEYLLQNGQIQSNARITDVHLNDVAYLTDPEQFPGLSLTVRTPENEDGIRK